MSTTNPDPEFNMEGFRRWVDEATVDAIIQQKSATIDKIKKNFNVGFGPAARFGSFKPARIGISLPSTGVITTAFKLTDPAIPKSEIIYGFMYTETRPEGTSYGHFIGTPRLIHHMCCASASLLSRDGEYRQRIIPVLTVIELYKKYPEIFEDLEQYVQQKINKFNWNIFTECFYPTNELKEYSDELEPNIASQRFAIKFLAMCWFIEFMNIYKKQKINHLNKLFKVIMKFRDKTEVEADIKFINSLKEKHGDESMYIIYNNINCFLPASRAGHQSQIKIGQKIIPLNLSEIQNPFNIRYKPWREYLICEKVQSLIINGICAGLPILGDYFFIRNTRKTLFDNYVQYMKLEHSDQAIGIARKLLEAQRGTFKPRNEEISLRTSGKTDQIDDENKKLLNTYKDDEDNPDSYQEIEEWLSGKFRLLHEKIKDPIEYAREEIIMSEMSLCVTSEYVGRTFYDAINICLDNAEYHEELGKPYENYDIWAKYIFELIYTLYALNSRKGLIHGDLHLNNFTIHPMYFSKFRNLNDIKNPHMMYALDANHYFAFPSRQYHTVVIDFSRAIIRPSQLDNFENFDIVHAKKLKLHTEGKIQLIKPEERSEFLYEQVKDMLKRYELYFPDFTATKKSSLHVLFLNNFDKLFPIFGGFDTYISINNMMLFFRKNGLDKKYPRHFKLIEGIFSKVENDLTETIEKLIEDPKSIDRASIEFINRKVLDEFFSDYLVIGPDKNDLNKFLDNNTIINLSFYENKEIYNIDEFKNFPGYLQTMKYYDKAGKLLEHSEGPSIKKTRTEFEKNKVKNLQYISEVASTYANKIF